MRQNATKCDTLQPALSARHLSAIALLLVAGAPSRGRLALDLLFRAGPLGRPHASDLAHAGPMDPHELVDAEVRFDRPDEKARYP